MISLFKNYKDILSVTNASVNPRLRYFFYQCKYQLIFNYEKICAHTRFKK